MIKFILKLLIETYIELLSFKNPLPEVYSNWYSNSVGVILWQFN
jgi:hypothetical protein